MTEDIPMDDLTRRLREEYKAHVAAAWDRVAENKKKPALTMEDAGDILWGIGVDSETRLQFMLELIDERPGSEAVPVVLKFWSCCDATSDIAWILISALYEWKELEDVSFSNYLSSEARAFYDDLPDEITIYRGGNEGSWLTRGFSWTTDRGVAENFGRGLRFTNKQPRLAIGKVLKQDVLAVFVDRQESELLVDSDDVDDIAIEWVAPWPVRPRPDWLEGFPQAQNIGEKP